MKSLTIITVFVISLCFLAACAPPKMAGATSMTNFNGDTTAYYQANIIIKKEQYINKKFKQLMWGLYLKDKQHNYHTRYKIVQSSTNKLYDQVLFTYYKNNSEKIIRVTLAVQQIPAEVSAGIKDNDGRWNKAIAGFYPQQIVKDIIMEN